MIEMMRVLGQGTCRKKITKTVGEWSPASWHHDSNGRPECPGAPVAEPLANGEEVSGV